MASIFAVGKIARAFTSTSGSRIVANNLSARLSNQKAFMCSQRGGKKVDPNVLVPDDFFDKDVETDKQFLDFANAIIDKEGGEGLEHVTSWKGGGVTWKDLEDGELKPFKSDYRKADAPPKVVEKRGKLGRHDVDHLGSHTRGQAVRTELFLNEDVSAHIDRLYGKRDEGGYIPTQQLNSSIQWKTKEDSEDNPLANFIPESNGQLFPTEGQGMRSCDGKLQRTGKEGILRCHKIDLQLLSHLDVKGLTRFTADDAEILPRRETGLCARCQRQVATTIKRARNYGLISHLGQYSIVDTRPQHRGKIYHDNANPIPGDSHTSYGLKETRTMD